MNGAQTIVHALKTQGITQIFGYPGGAIMPLYDALYESGLDHLLCRHEQGAVMAAIGYARATGRVGVCIATSGPGATNLITGLADALLDSVPIVAITGQVGTALIGTDAFQEVDVLGLSLACTKHSFLVESAEALPETLSKAFLLARSGRPGPVLIDIPKDIQLTEIASQPVLESVPELPQPAEEALARARQLLAGAQRPVLCAGGGVGIAQAVPALRQLAEMTQLPVVSTLKGLGAVPASWPTWLGMLGMHGNPAANLAVQQCDLLLMVGARFDDRVTGKLDTFAPHASVIHLDIDPAELGKLRQPQVALAGDLNQLLPALQQPLAIDDWRRHTLALKAQHHTSQPPTGDAIYVPSLLRAFSDRKPASTIVTTDVGQHQMWTAQHVAFDRPEGFITSGGLGTMGFGLPAAIGAQMGCPHAPVVCITGDGSFMMNLQELATLRRRSLPVKIILLDNQRLGMVKQWQQLFFDQRYSETILTDNPDFLALAQVFGLAGERITCQHQIPQALENLFASAGAYFLHVIVDETHNVWPLVPPGASNEQMLEGAA